MCFSDLVFFENVHLSFPKWCQCPSKVCSCVSNCLKINVIELLRFALADFSTNRFQDLGDEIDHFTSTGMHYFIYLSSSVFQLCSLKKRELL